MPVPPSRRTVLVSTAAGLAAAGVVGSRSSEAASSAPKPLPVPHDPVLHAVRRLSFGATPELVAHVRQTGVPAWVDHQLSGTPDVGALVHGTGLSSLPVTLPPVVQQMLAQDLAHYGLTDLQAATFARAAFGDNQLHEVLVDLFTNHLSIYGPNVAPYKVVDDAEVVRKHVLGSFADMLAASAQSPAMLLYLNQAYSFGGNPNENYARELLELHTVGAKGGYTQKDVHNAALALTGLSLSSDTGQFEYRTDRHYVGAVRVMGWSHANRTQSGGSTSRCRWSTTWRTTRRPRSASLRSW